MQVYQGTRCRVGVRVIICIPQGGDGRSVPEVRMPRTMNVTLPDHPPPTSHPGFTNPPPCGNYSNGDRGGTSFFHPPPGLLYQAPPFPSMTTPFHPPFSSIATPISGHFQEPPFQPLFQPPIHPGATPVRPNAMPTHPRAMPIHPSATPIHPNSQLQQHAYYNSMMQQHTQQHHQHSQQHQVYSMPPQAPPMIFPWGEMNRSQPITGITPLTNKIVPPSSQRETILNQDTEGRYKSGDLLDNISTPSNSDSALSSSDSDEDEASYSDDLEKLHERK